VKILLVLRHPFFLKNFTAGVKDLLARGHQVEIVFSEPPKGRVGENLTAEAGLELPGVSLSHHVRENSAQEGVCEIVSTVIDVLRYDTDLYDTSEFLRRRAYKMIRPLMGAKTLLQNARRIVAKQGYKAAHDSLMALLDGLKPAPDIKARIRSSGAEILVVSPLTPFGSEQANWILAARSLGIPAIYSMYSWDNLTNKGMLRPLPDGAIVWNESHRREAVELHGMEPDRILLAGAPGYDVWFDTQLTTDRATFCRRVGLDPDQPFVLYTCSSGSIAQEHEADFIEAWIQAIRSHSDPQVSRLGVLVRPHPQNAQAIASLDARAFGNVSVHPRKGAVPFAGTAREDFYCSIAHSMAVIGVNTSAMVEAAIIGRPIIAFESDVFGQGHLGTPHYRQLLSYRFLIRTPTVAENLDALARIVGQDAELTRYYKEGNARFVDEFIRPGDRLTPAAKRWADAVESLAQGVRGRQRLPAANPPSSVPTGRLLISGWTNAFLGSHVKRVLRGLKRRGRDARTRVARAVGSRRVRLGARLDKRMRRVSDVYVHVRLFGIHALPLSGADFVAERERKRAALSERGLVARIYDKGPYRILRDIEAALNGGGTAPEVLLLGDSVHYRVRYNDRDNSTLSEMVAGLLAPRSSFGLNGAAFHPRLFLATIRCVAQMPNRPKVVVIPVNLRSFSPQWWLKPENDYVNEIAALEAHRPGDEVPTLPPFQKNKDGERYRALAVTYPGTTLSSIGEFLAVIDGKSDDTARQAWRDRQIAIFHFMHTLEPDHPWLQDIVRCVEEARAAGMRPVVYVTPINYQWGVRSVGDLFATAVGRNTTTLRHVLEPVVDRLGGTYRDWSRAFVDRLFFNRDEKTEHLSDEGRRKLARMIVDELRPYLR
jgi:hypothetical protein